jgi:preprotein translocase subunit YajC
MGIWKDCGCGCNGEIAKRNFYISMLSAATFFIIMNSKTYKMTSKIFGNWVANSEGCPTFSGFGLHTIVFMAVSYLMMLSNTKKQTHEKLKASALSAMILYVVANPMTYKVTRSILGNWVATSAGCPHLGGLLLHSLVFMVIIYLIMNNKKVVKKSDTIAN